MKHRSQATPPGPLDEDPPRRRENEAEELHETIVQQLLRNITGGALPGSRANDEPATGPPPAKTRGKT